MISQTQDGNTIVIDGEVNGTRCELTLDTGASRTVIRYQLLKSFYKSLSGGNVQLLTATGQHITVRGEGIATFKIGGRTYRHEVVIADIVDDCIIGLDFMKHYNCKIDLKNGTFKCRDEVVSLKDNTLKNGYDVYRAIIEDGTVSKQRDIVQAILEDCKETLTREEMSKAKGLLKTFSDMFATHDGDLGRTGVVKHRIETGTEAPIRLRPRRVPVAYEKNIDKMIAEMSNHNVIEASSSPWCSPVVLVKKKDNSLRFCVDYRRLNDITKKDSYPLPRIDDTLDTLSGAKWFTTLDLKSGYWQVEIDSSHKEKTAFSTGKGLWQFKVMPFGLCNAPATFERLMEKVLSGLIGEACLVYFDDVVIIGKDFDDHIRNLQRVLSRLHKANLKLSAKKCLFFKRAVSYLGHIISEDGVRTDPEKIVAVKDWPVPKDKTEVRAFLGLCSYYRRFVRNFADIAKPLHRLTEQKRKFTWDGECEDAFNELKNRLCETPILGYPDQDGEYVVDTDASGIGIGGVLSQVKGEHEQVIAYFSKSLSKPERNYCVTRRELLAVVKTLQHFSKYLLGRKFRLRTDHAALKWLLQFKNPEGQVARWIEQLQEYDFATEHRKGRAHGNADALSRRPCEEDCKHCTRHEGREVAHVRILRTDTISPDWCGKLIQEEQQQDSDIKPILDWMKSSAIKPRWNDVASTSTTTKSYWAQWDSLVLHNGVLCRKWENTRGDASHLQLVVPRSKVRNILEMFHDGSSGGHLGVKRTLLKIKERFYWIHCREDVEDWIRKCKACAAVKGPQTRTRAGMKQYNVGAPWERIAVDIAGPFPLTEKGNKYIMVVMDYFTKWPEVFAIPNQEAVTVAEILVNDVFSRFGVPLEIHSDQGRNFESLLFQEVCRLMGIHKTRTTPYHPQSDGMVERFNQTLERHLAKLVDSHQKDWDKYIPLFLMSYRSAVHETTNVTPALAMFGRQLRLPADIVTGRPPDTPESVTEYAADLRNKLHEIHEHVRASQSKISETTKIRYDRKTNHIEFKEGSQVWLHNPTKRKGKSPKLQADWDGPYTIITKINDVTYRIKKMSGLRSKPKVVHINRLAPYKGSNDARDEHV
ncbi:unnamed protein product [Pieris macdunnoughi]|uniref:RNA-directed DNA polymerase n=1 Tax=Pieris macdunnoughi TaxID=345717 RepID=A0A821UUQ1_9NEOP|nr:unnamed protein product [Pieris macdunnoughi]